jgi:hypothetical protein
MDGINSSKRFTATETARINSCRLYMQATLVSDIATPCGRHIHKAYYEGRRSRRINWPSIQYPRQAKPDKTSWNLWRKGLQLAFLQDDKYHLRSKLGNWKPSQSYHHRWRWHYTPDGLHQQSPRTAIIKQYHSHETVRRSYQFQSQGIPVPSLPRDSIPVEPVKRPHHYQVSFHQIFPFP